MEVARDSRGSPSWQDTEDNNTRAGIDSDLGSNVRLRLDFSSMFQFLVFPGLRIVL